MDKLYRVNNVASQLGVSKNTVWNLVNAGKLAKPKKITNGISVWKESDIKAFIDSL